MKTPSSLLTLAGIAGMSLLITSCINVQTRPVPETVVTTTTYRPGYVVTTLPVGYQTRVYRGTSYYYHRGTYYRPSGTRYIVVREPL
ncbi:MAG TPA: DUF6515 family protein [Chthoniobacterales bacterium]